MISRREVDMARLAVQNGFCTRAQADGCLEKFMKDDRPPPIETILVEKGYLTNDQATALQLAVRRIRKDAEKKYWSVSGYEIYNMLGEGGLGVVFKSKQVSMNRLVALKILHKRWLSDEEFRKRFLVEARIVGKLSHPNLIKVFEVGREDWRYFFSMEFIDGETVEDWIEREGPLDFLATTEIAIEMVTVIRYLWSKQLVHCDIKPSNIMMDRDGRSKLGDFGFVKSNLKIQVDDSNTVLGTPDYISPEQAMGRDALDFRSDIYSLGATLYHMLSGRPPYEGSVSTIMKQHVKGDLPSLRNLRKDTPDNLLHVVEKMMAADQDDRYPELEGLEEDLERVRVELRLGGGDWDRGKTTLFEAIRVEKEKSTELEDEVVILRRKLRVSIYVLAAAATLLGVAFGALVIW
ncbi:MAG: serine/threonine-protein kinase [Planctomycetota bacterium]|nr:serine/threonine-protein kinase [Planctomycetota bacterium]